MELEDKPIGMQSSFCVKGSRFLLALREEAAQGRIEIGGRQIVVMRVRHGEEALRRRSGLEQALALSKRDKTILRRMRDEHRSGAMAYFPNVVITIANEPATGQPGEARLRHVGKRSEGGDKDQRPMRPATGLVRGDAAAERTTVENDAFGRHLSDLMQPIAS